MQDTYTEGPQCEVPARAHTDDYVFGADDNPVTFDAAPWLRSAAPEDIRALADGGWGHDLAADRVAIDTLETIDPPEPARQPQYLAPLAQMFHYLARIRDIPSKKDECGFEVEIDEEAAMALLDRERPATAALVREVSE